MANGLKLIMKEVGYSNYTLKENIKDFTYQNTIEKLYYESIGKHLSPYFTTAANEYDSKMLNQILAIPSLDDDAFTNMIRYAKKQHFKDINV